MSEKKSTEKIVKKRNWVCIAYPDSVPENWHEILQKTGLQCAVSPLHDSDVRADETQKKPHWHIIMCWQGPTAYSIAAKISASIGGTVPQPCENMRGAYRYFTHMDDPDKVQYNPADIVHINGFNIREYVEMTKNEINIQKRNIMHLVEEYGITEYCDLLLILDKLELPDTWDVAANNTIFCDAYIRSRRHKIEAEMRMLAQQN